MEKRVLILEDDAETRGALAAAFEDAGVRALVVRDGRDALATLRGGARASVILLDLSAPRLGGEAFLRELRSDPRFEHVPVVTMTTGAGRATGREIVAQLRNPLDFDDLLQIVLSLLEANAA